MHGLIATGFCPSFRVHGSAYSCKQMGVIRCNGLFRQSGAGCGQRLFSVQEGNVSGPPKKATFPRIGLPQARPLMVWFTTAWKIEAARSSLVAPSLISGCISDFAKYAAAGCDRIDSLVIFGICHSVRQHQSVKEMPSGQ